MGMVVELSRSMGSHGGYGQERSHLMTKGGLGPPKIFEKIN